MVCVKRKIRAKVRFFRELSEKCVKKAEKDSLISHKAFSPVPPNIVLERVPVLRRFYCLW